MRLKLCFKNTTHKIDNFPSGLEALQETIRKVFGNELPNKWFVIHLDNHKNEKIIKDEESYINILSLNEVDKSSKSIKFIIVDELDGASHGFENLIQSEKLPENTPVFCFRSYESLIREEENFLTEEPNLHQREGLKEFSDIQTLDKDQTTMGELEELGSETYDKDQNKVHKEDYQELHVINTDRLPTLSPKTSENEDLERQLNEGLEQNDIKDVEELAQKRETKREEYEKLRKEGKDKLAQRRKESLDELDRLALIIQKLYENKKRSTKIYQQPDNLEKSTTEDVTSSKLTQKVSNASNAKEGEEIKNLYQDYSSLPDCAEKSLMILRYYSLLKLSSEKNLNKLGIHVPQRIDDAFEKECDHLRDRLKVEDLYSATIDKCLAKCNANAKCGDWKEVKNELIKLLVKFRPLHIQELLRLISHGDEAAELNANEDVVLFLGGTGAGKSTTIHYLAGSKMAKTIVNGEEHIAPIEIKRSVLEKVTCSSAAKSETRYITSIPVDLKDLGSYNNGKVVLCDTPGFDDTEGPEVDIANALSIMKAIHNCNSVKPVLLISFEGKGDRSQGLKKIAHVLMGMIPGIQNYMNCLSYLFTKYPDNKRNSIHASLKNVHENLTEQDKSDIGFTSLFKDMLRKTEKGAIVVDPLETKNAVEILDSLIESNSIKRPEEAFKFSISSDSRVALENQARTHQRSIISAAERSEYDLAHYKLNELKHLCKLLELDDLKKIYNESATKLGKHINEQYKNGVSMLNYCLDDENALHENKIEQYKAYINNIQLADGIRETHLEKTVVRSSALIQNLMNQVEDMLRRIKEKNIKDISLKNIMDKIKLLSNYFPEIKSSYLSGCLLLEDLFNISLKSFRKFQDNNEFEKCGLELTHILNSISLLENHLNKNDMMKRYVELKEKFLRNIKSSVENLSPIFRQSEIKEQDVVNLKEWISKLESIKNEYTLKQHIPCKDIELIYNELVSPIITHFEALNNKVQEQFKQKRERSFAIIERLVKEMRTIRKIDAIEIETSELYHSTIEMLCNFIQRLKLDISHELSSISQKAKNINHDKICDYIVGLESAKWISEFKAEAYSDVIGDVEGEIYKYFKESLNSLKEIKLGIENFNNIEEAYQRVLTVREMKAFERIFTNLTQIGQEVNSKFDEKIKETFMYIDECLAGWTNNKYQRFEFIRAEHALQYLNVCKSVISSSNEASKRLVELEKFIKEYSENVQTEMSEGYSFILNFKQNSLSELYEGSIFNNSDSSRILDELIEIQEDNIHKEEEKNNKIEALNFDDIRKVQANKKEKKDLSSYERRKLFTNSKTLSSRLYEVYEIQNKYPNLLELFDPEKKLFEKWKKKLNENYDEMSDQMEDFLVAKHIRDLNYNIQIARSLSQLDEFLEPKSYASLSRNFQNRFYKEAPDTLKEKIDAIKEHDYENVSAFMLELAQSDNIILKQHLQRLKFILNNSLENLIDQTMSNTRFILLKSNITPEKIEPIVENLNKIKKAGRFLEAYLNSQVLDKYRDCERRVKTMIKDGLVQLLKRIEGSINSYNFYETDKLKQPFNIICGDLGSFCDEVILAEFNKLDKMEEDALEKLKKAYVEMKIEDFIKSPPKDLFAKFAKIEVMKPVYLEVQETIKDKIINAFREKLNEAREFKSFDRPNPLINNIKFALNSLPPFLKERLEPEIETCKAEIENAKSDHEHELNAVKNNPDLIRVADFVKECKESQMRSSFKKIEEHYFKKLEVMKSEIWKKLEKNQITDALYQITDLFEHKTYLSSYFEFINRQSSEIENYLSRTFDEKHSTFIKQFLNSDILNDDSTAMEETFTCLMNFNDFQNNSKSQNILNDTLSKHFTEKLIELNKHISEYFQEYHNKYNEALHNFDTPTLNENLKMMKKWKKLLPMLKSYVNRGLNTDVSFNALADILRKVDPSSKMEQSLTEKINHCKEEILSEKLINDNTTKFKNSREQFYEQLNKKFGILLKAKALDASDMNIVPIYEDCVEKMEEQKKELYHSTENSLKKIFNQDPTNSSVKRKDCEDFNIYCNNLLSYQKHLKFAKNNSNLSFDKIEETFFDKFSDWEEIFENDSPVESVVATLINMKILSLTIQLFQAKIDEKINELLLAFKNKKGKKLMLRLGQLLNHDRGGIGQNILSDYKCFKGFALSLFNTKTQAHKIDYVLQNLTGDEIEKGRLSTRYKEFDDKYKALVQKYLKPNPDLSQLISDTKLLAGNVKQTSSDIRWDHTISSKIPVLLAHIFAIWTLQNAEHYFEAKDLEDKDSYLLQPHAAQVISIFRLLGVGDKKEQLQNNLVQIGTGEGKSITLAVTASVFALLGFEVSCVCYSIYLSERDHEAFKTLFDTLNVSKTIHYGTFNKLCEDALNQNGDIRELMRDMISKGAKTIAKANQQSKSARILLVDEVDVFFSKEFYGKLYTPSTVLQDPTIGNLTDLIWKLRNSELSLNNIKNTAEYQACCNRFREWKFIIEEAVKDMLFDIKEYQSHDYVCKDDKIGYREHENILYNVVYRYQTLFASYNEHEKGKISLESLNENKNIQIKCGHFSYAEIPKQFNYIMGVTGTLKTLNHLERKTIQETYGIHKHTYAPSVYGKNDLKFTPKDDVMIENGDDYYKVILKEITNMLSGRNKGKRAVLVFFETTKS